MAIKHSGNGRFWQQVASPAAGAAFTVCDLKAALSVAGLAGLEGVRQMTSLPFNQLSGSERKRVRAVRS